MSTTVNPREILRQEKLVAAKFRCVWSEVGECQSDALNAPLLSSKLPPSVYFRMEKERSEASKLQLVNVCGRPLTNPLATMRNDLLVVMCPLCKDILRGDMRTTFDGLELPREGTARFEQALKDAYQEWIREQAQQAMVRKTFKRLRDSQKKDKLKKKLLRKVKASQS